MITRGTITFRFLTNGNDILVETFYDTEAEVYISTFFKKLKSVYKRNGLCCVDVFLCAPCPF